MNYSLLAATATTALPLSFELRWQLSTLNFLENAVMSAWFVVLGQYLETLKFPRKSIARIYATFPIDMIVTPMIAAALADRYVDTRWLLVPLLLMGAGLLVWMAKITTPKKFYVVSLIYFLLYSPTMSLVNSLTFYHLPDADRDYPGIRMVASLGWVLAGLSLKLFLKPNAPMNNRPIYLAAVLSVVTALFSFALPATPPRPDEATAIIQPLLQSLALFKNTSFTLVILAACMVMVALSIYFSFGSIYLEQKVKVRPSNVGPLMTLGQWVEMGALLTLPWFLLEVHMKWVLVIGLLVWVLRFGIFAIARPFALVILGVAIHGFACDFFVAASIIYVDGAAPKAIQASAQALFAILTYGLAMYFGSEAAGWLNQWLTHTEIDPATGEETNVTAWGKFWLVPAAGILAFTLLFATLFHDTAPASAEPSGKAVETPVAP